MKCGTILQTVNRKNQKEAVTASESKKEKDIENQKRKKTNTQSSFLLRATTEHS